MSEGLETPPFWARRFGRALLAWMGLCVLLTLGLMPLGEAAPWLPALGLFPAIVALPALVFLAWSVVGMIRRPREWPAVLVVIAFVAAFVFGFLALMTTGARLHFLWRHPIYERIMADAAAGRLRLDENGASRGRRYGVSYSVYRRSDGRILANFAATDELYVLYDEWDCYGRNPPPPPPQPPPSETDGVEPPTIKNAGRLNAMRWVLSDRACLVYAVW